MAHLSIYKETSHFYGRFEFSACADNSWGIQCNQTCGRCATYHPCNKETGACLGGMCLDGWTGVNCDTGMCLSVLSIS